MTNTLKVPMNKTVPCVLFAYNRPDMFARVVSAIKTQIVDHVIVFIDGPKNDAAVGPVEECKRIARGIDWTGVDYFFKDRNEGLAGIVNNICAVFRSYDSAVFVEDDCLPMPSFYSVMKRALQHYGDDRNVFSIGGYQQLPEGFFISYPYSFVSSARFMCWGWATWKDRWDSIAPFLSRDAADLKSYRNIPDTAGDDLVSFARDFARGPKRLWEMSSWDIRVAILSLYFDRVHLLSTRGLVKNIGLDTGVHFSADDAIQQFYNRNVYDETIDRIAWPKDTALDSEYNRGLKTSVDTARDYILKRAESGALRTTPVTLSEIIEKAPRVLYQLRTAPFRTIRKIIAHVIRRPAGRY